MTLRTPDGLPRALDPFDVLDLRQIWAGWPYVGGTQAGFGLANRTVYRRILMGSGTISKVGLYVGASSGNICVSVHRNTGSGRASAPSTRVATSGSVVCPAAGYREIALDVAVAVAPGDWLAVGVDNTTVSFWGGASGLVNWTDNGLEAYENVFPAPATPAVLDGIVRSPLLIGLP